MIRIINGGINAQQSATTTVIGTTSSKWTNSYTTSISGINVNKYLLFQILCMYNLKYITPSPGYSFSIISTTFTIYKYKF